MAPSVSGLQQAVQRLVAGAVEQQLAPGAALLTAAAQAVEQCPPPRRVAQARLVAASCAGAYLAWFDPRGRGWVRLAAGEGEIAWIAGDQAVVDVVVPVRAGTKVVDPDTRELARRAQQAAQTQTDLAVVGCRLVTPLAPMQSRWLSHERTQTAALAATDWWEAPARFDPEELGSGPKKAWSKGKGRKETR